jgi:hypothetical protein
LEEIHKLQEYLAARLMRAHAGRKIPDISGANDYWNSIFFGHSCSE